MVFPSESTPATVVHYLQTLLSLPWFDIPGTYLYPSLFLSLQILEKTYSIQTTQLNSLILTYLIFLKI